MAYGKGFLMVSASPLTRSSYHAGDDFAACAAREAPSWPPRPAATELTGASAAMADRHTPKKRHLPYTPSSSSTWSPTSSAIPSSCPGASPRASGRKREESLIVAELVIGFKGIRENGSQAGSKLDRRQPPIDVTYEEGPFKYLNNHWIFEPTPGRLRHRLLSSISSSARACCRR